MDAVRGSRLSKSPANPFESYGRRSRMLDGNPEARQRWFDALVHETYLPHLPADRGARILEIGCNRGYFLRTLQRLGYTALAGVDLSPEDVADAVRRTGLADLHCADAGAFLRSRPRSFDAVVFKAVLEHVDPADAPGLLADIAAALVPDGIALCEVPNMDWYAAARERYMDLTHRTGFTRESLSQLFEGAFADVSVVRVNDPSHGVLATRRRRVARKLFFHAVRRLLYFLGEDTAESWFAHRSILAVARRPLAPVVRDVERSDT